jgi:tetratricopeptide (TPR) repeat protein
MSEPTSVMELVQALCAEQRRRWQQGDRVSAGDYLEQHRTIREEAERAVELIYNEVLLREQAGETPRLEEYLRRYPQFADQLCRVFEVHRALDASSLQRTDPSGVATDPGGRAPPRADADAPPAVPGFDVQGRVARGGMGVVWKARQVRLDRVVALKMLRGDDATPEELSRFRLEAEAQARLSHPNVVQVFEVGDVGGRPYFALEYADGGTLAEALRGGPQPARQAARLIRTLALAVEHAHRRGLVHRDLKPGNVLLFREGSPDGEGAGPVPKISDFGLAKRLQEASGQTRSGEVLGTPSYMSPEQAAGKVHEVGPAADVWALGAILYECLTGRPPFLGETAVDTLLQVKNQEPVPPRRLQPKVPRDLETICLKCLRKDRARRYADAKSLADDLGRFLDGKPILARPVGRAERLWRWSRRNPALACLAAALLAGFVGVLWQWGRAEREWGRAERNQRQDEESLRLALQVMGRYITEVSEDPHLSSHDLEGLRTRLLRSALPFYQDFVRLRPDNPQLHAERGKAHLRLAVLTSLTGSRDEALGLFQQALATFDDLVRRDPEDPDYRADLALIHAHLGVLHQQRDLKTAEQEFQQALDLRRRLAEEKPTEPRARADLAASLLNLSTVYAETGRLKQSLPPHEEALRLLEALARERPEEPAYRVRLAQGHTNLAMTHRDFGDDSKERASLEKAMALLEELTRQHPSVAAYQADLGRCYRDLGTCHGNAHRLPEAGAALRKARQLQQKLRDAHPSLVDYQCELAMTCTNLGNCCKLAKQPQEAEEALRQAIDLFAALAQGDRGNATYQAYLAAAHHNLGTFYIDARRHDDADKELRCGLDLRRQLAAAHPNVTLYAAHLGSSLFSLCLLERARERRDEALKWSAEAIRVLTELRRREPGNARAKALLLNSHIDRGQIFLDLASPAKAMLEWDHAIALAGGRLRDRLRYARATTLVKLGRHGEATAEADRWAAPEPPSGDLLLLAAGVYALASDAAKEEAPRARGHADRAMALLTRAAGHLPAAKLAEQIGKDEAFASLRPRDDYKKLLSRLSDSARAKSP